MKMGGQMAPKNEQRAAFPEKWQIVSWGRDYLWATTSHHFCQELFHAMAHLGFDHKICCFLEEKIGSFLKVNWPWKWAFDFQGKILEEEIGRNLYCDKIPYCVVLL